ncbi:RolB family protein (plasmid) [Agrobacterium leguminum]|uniref:Protein 6b n=1 Tax=Agrobacterium deltaense NCPPB 1641 TaxID=1183425 RepID=A0A1S7UAF1_9HYPH|nr:MULTISPECIES: RolB family protein [Agrobacterium]WFS69680.1 RolB family protein [Agrobacterium leguminum]CVI63867.1 Protein 6b [Agrobacterium deltaense NCPPB 1641]
MAVSSWAVRDFTRISIESELRVRLEQARTDFRAMLTDIVYFNRSSENPNEFDDEYILTDQAITFVYVDQATARACALNRRLPSSSSNCGAVATEIPPWLLSSQQLNHILRERCDQGGLVNYYNSPEANTSFLAIFTSSVFVRFGTELINGENYGFYSRQGNYTEEGEDDEDEDTRVGEENEDHEVQAREVQIGDLIHYPIVAFGTCHPSP